MQSDDCLPTRDKSAILLLPSDQTLHVLKFQCVGDLSRSNATAEKRATLPLIVFARTQTTDSSLWICAQMTLRENTYLF